MIANELDNTSTLTLTTAFGKDSLWHRATSLSSLVFNLAASSCTACCTFLYPARCWVWCFCSLRFSFGVVPQTIFRQPRDHFFRTSHCCSCRLALASSCTWN